MDRREIRELLRRVDDPMAVDRPSTQDVDRDSTQAVALADDLRLRFGDVTAEIGPPAIQDASHLAHLAVPPASTGKGHGIWVRISNFGRLATAGAVWPNAYGGGEIAEPIDAEEWRDVLGLVESRGFIYVPQEILLEEYNGTNRPLMAFYEGRSRLTWWVRFFGWI